MSYDIQNGKMNLSRQNWEAIGLASGWMDRTAIAFDIDKMRKFVSKSRKNIHLYEAYQTLLQSIDEAAALALVFRDYVLPNPVLTEEYLLK